MRVGVMGGTFDPIHVGHLVAAEEACYQLRLDKVLFVPAGNPPHKARKEVTPAVHRVRMVSLAIASNPFFGLSMVDADRFGLSYTVDMLPALRRELGPSVELFFVIGMDSLAELLTWRAPAEVISLCRLAVVNRPPQPPVDLAVLEEKLPGIVARVDFVEMPGICIASSDLQARVASGRPIRYQVPEAVEEYIRQTGLYRSEDT